MPDDDLGLKALARIQALDAAELVQRFRDTWTDGAMLQDEVAATAWMRSHLGADVQAQLFELGFYDTFERTRHLWDAGGCTWATYSATGAATGHYRTEPGSAMWSLGVLVCQLGESFGSEWIKGGPMFVLVGTIPQLRPVGWWGVHRVRADSLRNASGPLSEEVVLFVRPQATEGDVTNAYKAARERIASRAVRLQPRKRIKPMYSDRACALAVLGGRIALNQFDTWDDALAYYRNDPETRYDKTYGEDVSAMSVFRRDVRRAYEGVTGLALDFQPKKRGEPPSGVMRWQDDAIPPTVIKTASKQKGARKNG